MTLVLPPTRRLIALACFTSTCRPAGTAGAAAGETPAAGAGGVEYEEAGERGEADRAWVERVRGADLDAVVEERVVRADANRQLVEELLHGLGARPPGEGAAIDLDDHRHGPLDLDLVAGAEQDVARLPLDARRLEERRHGRLAADENANAVVGADDETPRREDDEAKQAGKGEAEEERKTEASPS